jgi:NUMOD3 motif
MPNDRRFYVYVMFRPWNGVPCYVGKGTGRRAFRPSRRLNQHLANIIERAGGSLPTVIIRDALTEREAFNVERALIAALGRGNRGSLANLTDGGEGASGWSPSPEYRKNVSVRSKGNTYCLGRKQSKEEIEQRRKANKGKQRNAEFRQNLSKRSEGNKYAQGRIVSPETRSLISSATTGRIFTPKHRKKLSDKAKGNQRRLGKFHTAETRQKISESKRRRAREVPAPNPPN